eukprot:4930241-Pleurochrysis_carterae.AAC.6
MPVLPRSPACCFCCCEAVRRWPCHLRPTRTASSPHSPPELSTMAALGAGQAEPSLESVVSHAPAGTQLTVVLDLFRRSNAAPSRVQLEVLPDPGWEIMGKSCMRVKVGLNSNGLTAVVFKLLPRFAGQLRLPRMRLRGLLSCEGKQEFFHVSDALPEPLLLHVGSPVLIVMPPNAYS